MSTPHVVAIDLGTSGPKVAVVDPDGHPAGTARAHLDTLQLPGGGVEQDSELAFARLGMIGDYQPRHKT
ncbi:MAG: hypothetical protein GY925_20275 [Actinomycetia bacterium]|nr:hypothetical protein [Actinomycetes bacterium]